LSQKNQNNELEFHQFLCKKGWLEKSGCLLNLPFRFSFCFILIQHYTVLVIAGLRLYSQHLLFNQNIFLFEVHEFFFAEGWLVQGSVSQLLIRCADFEERFELGLRVDFWRAVGLHLSQV
jgi:hypothetical protein